MKSVAKDANILIEIKKSKFYAYVYYVENELDVKMHIDELKHKFSDATHICYAYVLSSPKMEKACDDGEPDGTAGKPILEVIKKRELENIFIAVVRYFGGVKLGAGGLARAYSSSAASVIDASGVGQYELTYYYDEIVSISNSKNYLNMLENNGATITSIEYSQDVHIKYYSFVKLSDNYVECKLSCRSEK